MASPNPYYNNDTNLIEDGDVGDKLLFENKFEDVVGGLDIVDDEITAVEDDVAERIHLSNADNTVFAIADNAASRANKTLGFDGSGNLTLLSGQVAFKDDWATTTSYIVGDLVRDVAGDYGAGANAILSCVTGHTSVTLASEKANWEEFATQKLFNHEEQRDESLGSTVTLTATSDQYILIYASGATVTLPDATTMTEGRDTFIIDQSCDHNSQTVIKNNGGDILHRIESDCRVYVSLVNNGSADGQWRFDDPRQRIKVGAKKKLIAGASTNGDCDVSFIDSQHFLMTYVEGAATKISSFRLHGDQVELVDTAQIHASINAYSAVQALSTTAALVGYTEGNTEMYVVDVAIAADYTLTVGGTPLSIGRGTSYSWGMMKFAPIDATHALFIYSQGGSATDYSYAVSITTGSPPAKNGTTYSIDRHHYSLIGVTRLSSTKYALMMKENNSSYRYVYSVTLSGTAVASVGQLSTNLGSHYYVVPTASDHCLIMTGGDYRFADYSGTSPTVTSAISTPFNRTTSLTEKYVIDGGLMINLDYDEGTYERYLMVDNYAFYLLNVVNNDYVTVEETLTHSSKISDTPFKAYYTRPKIFCLEDNRVMISDEGTGVRFIDVEGF